MQLVIKKALLLKWGLCFFMGLFVKGKGQRAKGKDLKAVGSRQW
jgi:hypothetical protein